LKVPNLHVLKVDRASDVLWIEHIDQVLLERFFSAVYGTIEWM
jgi:hypothetical protein